jgi:hypothetical protein
MIKPSKVLAKARRLGEAVLDVRVRVMCLVPMCVAAAMWIVWASVAGLCDIAIASQAASAQPYTIQNMLKPHLAGVLLYLSSRDEGSSVPSARSSVYTVTIAEHMHACCL